MKKLLLMAVLALFSSASFSQEHLKYEEVVQVPNVAKGELFKRAEMCMIRIYKNSKNSLEVKDSERGQLTGKLSAHYDPSYLMSSAQTRGDIDFILNIYVKDNRYKILINDVYWNAMDPFNGYMVSDTICPKNRMNTMAPKRWNQKAWREAQLFAIHQINMVADLVKKEMEIASPISEDW